MQTHNLISNTAMHAVAKLEAVRHVQHKASYPIITSADGKHNKHMRSVK